MSPEWLLHDGQPFADALVFSHDEQVTRLKAVVPEALPAAIVVGDPCFDRLRASLPLRETYRQRLDLGRPATVVTVSSTWGPQSLLGTWPSLVRELLSELPVDSYRVLLVAHPNVWFAHGPWQLRNWFADATRAGLTLIDPLAGWQQAILASDVVIGDHGAVTGYAAALGIPTLLGIDRTPDVVEGTAIDLLTRTTPRLDPTRPLLGQLRPAVNDRSGDIAELVSGLPGLAARRLRGVFYSLLSLPEPLPDPPVHPYPSTDLPSGRPTVAATLVCGSAHLLRYPADVLHQRSASAPLPDGHLVVHANHPMETLRVQAAILYCDRAEAGPDEQAWHSTTHHLRPACVLTAVVDGDCCTLSDGTHPPIRLASATGSPLLFASAVYLLLAAGRTWDDLPAEVSVSLGPDLPPATATISR